MPRIDADGCKIHVEVEGPENAPVLMLSNSLGTNLHMWDAQAAAFARHFRLVRYDRRGHGQSDAPKGPYSMERFGRDVLAILDNLGIRSIHWLGLSMGGMVGQWLGAKAPERIGKLILSNTSCYYADKDIWNGRIKTIRDKGLTSIVGPTMERWFSPGFRQNSPKAIADMTAMFVATPLEGYIGCCEAIRDMDHRDLVSHIDVPTLIIAGTKDPATTVDDARYIEDRIAGSKLATIEAAHISNIEQPDAYTKIVLDFLRS